ncbi:pentapeptide repeat-containing protein [Acidovorax sp. Root568]|uniref:pentapeptide repeat-containing protein n=1 Tax=Acidovorax sp. Root568 TaxID=1736565 RepID=UPI000A8F2E44|nr:pentapeptide repeat-containing protein [Acidovorax sp. Root568]
MADSFFDLGKGLPKIDALGLQSHLATETEIFEQAFLPTSTLQASTVGDTLPFKDKVFKRMRFYETHFVRVVFTRCTFDECLFLGAHFEDCAFHECVFVRCNTNKFRLSRTYLDPRSFLSHIFDRKKYPNVGVDLFHTLMKNSIDESQPEFRDAAEYHFRLWQRYNRFSYWRAKKGTAKWLNFRFFAFWFWNAAFQVLFGYGVRARNILLWTPVLYSAVWAYNHAHWSEFGIDPAKLSAVPLPVKTAFFTLGNMSTFGTADLTPSTPTGLIAVSCQVLLGIAWIALSTAMIVKRFVR